MNDRVRVQNMAPYDIGLKTQSGVEFNIKAHLFVNMTRDDVEYNMAIAPSLFTPPAQLVVSDEVLNEIMGIDNTEVEPCTMDVAEKYLKGPAQKLKTWLSENNYPHVLETVYQAAEKMDLPASKIKVLQEFMPLREFIDG